MEVEDLAMRILSDVEHAFLRKSDIDEVDIIPVLESHNRSPVIQVGNKLALEAWCVNLLFLHCYNHLMESRKCKPPKSIKDIQLRTFVVLLLNPDVVTAWNIRKELLSERKLGTDEDFRLTKLVIRRKPKTSEAFIHRRWLLKLILNDSCSHTKSGLSLEELAQEEILVCTMAASLYCNNYAAWNHRQWVHTEVTNKNFGVSQLEYEMLQKDFKWSYDWIETHLSDHSGFHFRQFLLRAIIEHLVSHPSDFCQVSAVDPDIEHGEALSDSHSANINATPYNILIQEKELITQLIRDYPGHEALWYHRRFVIHALQQYIHPCLTTANSTGPTCKRTKRDAVERKQDFKDSEALFQEEISYLDNFSLGRSGIESDLAARQKRWLATLLHREIMEF